MMRGEWSSEFCDQNSTSYEDEQQDSPGTDQHDFSFNFDLLSLVSKAKDYYRILEVDFDASEEVIRSNYIRLALKWHPDKQKDQDAATTKFQEINEAYQEESSGIISRSQGCLLCRVEKMADGYWLLDEIRFAFLTVTSDEFILASLTWSL